MSRIAKRSTALAPIYGTEALQPNGAPFTAHGGVQVPGALSAVYAFLALSQYDRRRRLAQYALRVVNASEAPVTCRCYGIERNGVPVLVRSEALVAAPRSVMDTQIPVHTRGFRRLRGLVVDVLGPGTELRVEAPGPAAAVPPSPSLLALASLLLSLGIAIAALVAAVVPRLTVLDVPPSGFTGTPLDVAYSRGGLGLVRYDLATRDGKTVAGGASDAPVGVLHIYLPQTTVQRTYRLRVSAIGPLGKDTRSVAIAVLPMPHVAAVTSQGTGSQRKAGSPIGNLAVTPTPATAGDMIHVSYTASGTQGRVWLVDQTGRTWASVPFSVDGESLLRVPEAAAGRPMRVVLQVQNGTRRATSSVGIFVTPAATTAADAASSASDDAVPASAASETPGMTLSQYRAAPGETVRALISGPHEDAMVTLTDAQGETIEEGDAARTQDAIALTAPPVDEPTTFYVVASITRGVSSTSVVRKLEVVPAR